MTQIMAALLTTSALQRSVDVSLDMVIGDYIPVVGNRPAEPGGKVEW